MVVIETKKEPFNVRGALLVVAVIAGFLLLGGVIYWMVKPSGPRQVKLTGEEAKEAAASYVPPTASAVLPPQPALPAGTDPGPTRLTLDLKQVTARQALDEIARQAKVQLKNGGQNQGFLASMMTERMDVSLKNEPFWTAVLDICKRGRLAPYADWDSGSQISFRQSGTEPMGPMVAVGSCLLVLDGVRSRFDADLIGTRPAGRNLSVQMRLFVEPRISPYRISAVATIEEAVDENGVSLMRPRNQWDDRDQGGPPANWMKDVECELSFPENAGGQIARLKGYASVATAGEPRTEKIDNPLQAKNVDVKVDGVLVRLVELRRDGNNRYTARMAGDVNSPVFKEYEKFSKIATLVDANGKEFESSGNSWGGGRGNTMDFSLSFSGGREMSAPKELRITLPTQLKEIRVPFEFTDLPLPH